VSSLLRDDWASTPRSWQNMPVSVGAPTLTGEANGIDHPQGKVVAICSPSSRAKPRWRNLCQPARAVLTAKTLIGYNLTTEDLAPPMIQIHNLSKNFGQLKAWRYLNLDIQQGEFFAFLGPNAAGKTTTIKMLTGLIRPSAGHCIVAATTSMIAEAAKGQS